MGPLRRLRRFPCGIDRQLWASCVMGPCVGCVAFLVQSTADYFMELHGHLVLCAFCKHYCLSAPTSRAVWRAVVDSYSYKRRRVRDGSAWSLCCCGAHHCEPGDGCNEARRVLPSTYSRRLLSRRVVSGFAGILYYNTVKHDHVNSI